MATKKLNSKAEKKAIEKIVFTSLSILELREKAKKLRQEIAKTGLETKVKRAKNVRALFFLRKQLAKVLTVLHDKMSNDNENH